MSQWLGEEMGSMGEVMRVVVIPRLKARSEMYTTFLGRRGRETGWREGGKGGSNKACDLMIFGGSGITMAQRASQGIPDVSTFGSPWCGERVGRGRGWANVHVGEGRVGQARAIGE